MAAVSLAARVVLAAALAFAAVAKLRVRDDTRRQTLALVGGRAGPVVAVALPFVELAVAVALVGWWSPIPAVVAVVLLLGFSAVLVRAQLRQLPCPCFGGVANKRATGASAIARNAVLVAYAVLATASPSGAGAVGVALLTVAFGVVAAAAIAAS